MKKIITNKSQISFTEYIKTILNYRFFAFSLAQGEIKNKYARNFTGYFLSIIQTLIGLSVYWLIFGIAIGIDTGSIPYPVFVLPGIISWQYFSSIVGNSSGSLLGSANLINKLYFPRIILPLSKIFIGLVDFVSGFFLFLILFIISGQNFNLLWISLPLWFLLLLIISLTFGLWAAILSLYIQDISQIIIQLTNFLIFVTPVFFPGTIVPDNFKFILYLNPIAGFIEYFRAILFGNSITDYYYILGFGIVIILFFSGLIVFKRIEKHITDLL